MAIIEMHERRTSIKKTLLYAYRGDEHEHEVSQVTHIGGNVFSLNPIKYDEFGELDGVNVDNITDEFEEHNSRYTGIAQKLYKHLSISIAPGETLTNYQWFEAANETMKALGFNESSKWTAVKHNDKQHEHIHIIYSLVNDEGKLIDQHLDAHEGFKAMRDIELKYGLTVIKNPENTLSVDATKAQIKAAGRKENITQDWGRILRGRINRMMENNGNRFPHSMSAFVVELNKVGIDIKITTDTDGQPKGISYRATDKEDAPWISGSKLKATMLTFSALQKRGVSYISARDDVMLKLKEPGDSLTLGFTATRIFSIKVNLKSVRKMKARNERLLETLNSHPFFDLTLASHLADKQLLIAFLKLIEALKVLFGGLTSEEEAYLLHRAKEALYTRLLKKEVLNKESDVQEEQEKELQRIWQEINSSSNRSDIGYELSF